MSGPWPFNGWRDTAARWFVRLRSEPMTPRLDSKFRRWLASDSANEVDYERHELAWELAGELARDEEIERLLADAQRAATAERRAPRYMVAWSAAAAMLIGAVGVGVYVQRAPEAIVYATAIGEQRTVVLPDQSRMALNTSTRVRVAFTRGVRAIELESGEATFDVRHDAARPFEVQAAGGVARALGTEFNVLSAADGVTVSVLSGKVQVLAPNSREDGRQRSSALLMHGEEATYSSTGLSSVEPANAARITAWHSGRIAFDNLDLSAALREFNRYGSTPIVLADAALADVRVSGVFRIGETEALLSALDTAFDIEARRGQQAIELRTRK